MMMEFQVTQEYLGFSNHLAFHGTTWEECLQADTYQHGEGSPVYKNLTGIAGVANTGQDPNFCGYVFAQANWYAYGRLAWDPTLSAEQIADEWVRQTFLKPEGMKEKAFAKKFQEPVKGILMASREAVVDYAPVRRDALRAHAVGPGRPSRLDAGLLPQGGQRGHRLRPHAHGFRQRGPVQRAAGIDL